MYVLSSMVHFRTSSMVGLVRVIVDMGHFGHHF